MTKLNVYMNTVLRANSQEHIGCPVIEFASLTLLHIHDSDEAYLYLGIYSLDVTVGAVQCTDIQVTPLSIHPVSADVLITFRTPYRF